MDAASILRIARGRAGLTQRELARRAGTSHPTVAAYETGRKTPSTTTFARLLEAAGFEPTVEMTRRPDHGDSAARGRELIDALELAGMFPANLARELRAPIWPPRVSPAARTPAGDE